ncbi:GNAT family N-acetyltransferase [Deinococcus sp. Leaf326]|uniref:GNAT family N-acetyltransferase n=1 Tax=Deinococcus sp. Leaf326 TaxID=1736338 RepID=UPI0007013616|nr:GNAT family protein [Deinococcus sp. Leaf326]KQR41131.1 acetyltransferase [Deinococcus sp. Leaf326]
MAALTLRPLRSGDEVTAARWGQNRDFCLANGWTPGLSERVLCRHWLGVMAGVGPGFLRLGIEEEGRLIGYTDLADLTRLSGEFGIALGEPATWGQGRGTRAGRLMLAHAFGPLGLREVRAEVHAPNTRSHALLRRLGFVRAGEGEPEPYRGERVAVLRYRLTRDSFIP